VLKRISAKSSNFVERRETDSGTVYKYNAPSVRPKKAKQ